MRSGANGLRSSCARSAKNSSLRRSASRSAASACFRSVISRAILDAPMTWPSSSRKWRDRQRDIDPSTVFGNPNGLEMLDPFAAAEPLQDRMFLVMPLGRDDQGDRLAHGLAGRVAEQALGPGCSTIG